MRESSSGRSVRVSAPSGCSQGTQIGDVDGGVVVAAAADGASTWHPPLVPRNQHRLRSCLQGQPEAN